MQTRPSGAGIDVGGTFTDVVAVGRDGSPRAVKVPTTEGDQGEGVAAGLLAAGARDVHLVAHGTTTATNAVLQRAVSRVVLVGTRGFADLLTIARQDRPSLYDLSVVRPEPLVPAERVVGVHERMGPDGHPVIALEDSEVQRVVAEVAALHPEAVAVSLLFSYAGGDHERTLAAALAPLDVPVTTSGTLAPEFREYERTSTCVLNAAVQPVMRRYLTGLTRRLPSAIVTVMTSGGGTIGVERAAEAPVHTLLSGPAAGVVAAGHVAAAAGFPDAVAFDMGGTSTDVCLIRDGNPEISGDGIISGLPFRTPAVAVHTVGAGGGSIASVDAGGALRVGPRSAGARPGPACYGHGGTEPTVTDAHCVLGHLNPGEALGGRILLDPDAARAALSRLPRDAGGADGVLAVVRATMARALRRVTTERGVDPAGLALVAYGGAGPLHAVALGRELGCAAVVVPPAPGVLSALGLLLAPPRVEMARTVLGERRAHDEVWAGLEQDARAELSRQGVRSDVEIRRVADLRYAGQSHELRVEAGTVVELEEALHTAHREAYGYDLRDERVEVVTLRAIALGRPALASLPRSWDHGPARPERSRDVGVHGRMVRARVVDRAALRPGDDLSGPAVVEQPDATTLLGPDDRAVVDDTGNLVVVL